MESAVKSRLAPGAGKHQEPIKEAQSSASDSYCTTAIGANQLGAVKGWEAIPPKHTHNKPAYLITAQAKVQSTWSAYLWLIDSKPEAYAAQQEAWERFDAAKRACELAWEASEQGLDALPIPF